MAEVAEVVAAVAEVTTTSVVAGMPASWLLEATPGDVESDILQYLAILLPLVWFREVLDVCKRLLANTDNDKEYQ